MSIGFDAVSGLRGLSLTLKGVIAGKVHRVTCAATTRSDLYMLQDTPGGLFVVLDEAPMGRLLANEHVLLVGVQHVTGMWVLRGMRMRTYFSAIKVETADAMKYGGLECALQDAQQLAVACVLPLPPAGCLARRDQAQAESVERRHGLMWPCGQERVNSHR